MPPPLLGEWIVVVGLSCHCFTGLPLDPIICGKDIVEEAALLVPAVTIVAVSSMVALAEVNFAIMEGDFVIVDDIGSPNGGEESC